MRYKDYRNVFSTFGKRSKTSCYNQYFGINWNNIKNTWKDIKSMLIIKSNQLDIAKI